MSIGQALLPEFDHEMAGTRKVLERLPDHQLEWKAHDKSNSIGWVGKHLAEIPGWASIALETAELDLNPPGGPAFEPSTVKSKAEVLALFDQKVAAARQSLAAADDAVFSQPWTLKSGGQTILTMPKLSVYRSFVMNHMIHHRAILTVYYRLNGIPVPALYGPSGDED